MTRSAYMLSRAKNSIISSETDDLISLLLSYCIATHPVLRLVLVGSPLQKSLMLRRFKSDQDKFCRNVLQINAHRLTETDFRFHVKKFQDDGHDVISRRKVPPPGEWTRSVCRHICSSVLPVPDLYYIRTCYIYILRLTHSGGCPRILKMRGGVCGNMFYKKLTRFLAHSKRAQQCRVFFHSLRGISYC